MNMKKIIIAAAMILALSSLTACKEKNSESSSETDTASHNTSVVFTVDDEEFYESESAQTNLSTNSETSSDTSEITLSESVSSTVTSSQTTASRNTSSKATSSKTVSSKAPVSSVVSSAPNSDTVTSSASTANNGTDSEFDTEYTVSEELVESSLSGYESEISGEWRAKYILDENNSEIDGEELYGTAYRQYGGIMILNDDGTFSVRMGVNSDDESTQGTFTYFGGGDIQLLYENDSTVICERVSINGEDAIAMPVELFGDTFTVYFTVEFYY